MGKRMHRLLPLCPYFPLQMIKSLTRLSPCVAQGTSIKNSWSRQSQNQNQLKLASHRPRSWRFSESLRSLQTYMNEAHATQGLKDLKDLKDLKAQVIQVTHVTQVSCTARCIGSRGTAAIWALGTRRCTGSLRWIHAESETVASSLWVQWISNKVDTCRQIITFKEILSNLLQCGFTCNPNFI